MLVKELGTFVAETRYEDLPREVIECAKMRILDLITAAAVSYRAGTYRPLMEIVSGSTGCAAGKAAVWFEGTPLPLRDAVLLNSFISHSTYFEDGSRYTGGHPSSVVIPAAITVGEIHRSSGKDVILSTVLGYDIFIRLGRTIYPSTVVRGFQSTAVLGAPGAAAASAAILKLDSERSKNAISIACNLGVGFKDALKTPDSQPIQVGRGCEGGVLSALMARKGIPGSDTILENGFLKGFADLPDAGKVNADLGRRFLILDTYIKIHGGCRGNHAPIDVVLDIMKTHDISPALIEAVQVAVDSVTLAASFADPIDGKQAQMSIPFAVAVGILEGNSSIYQYTDEKVKDPKIRALMSKIQVEVDPALNKGYPDRRGSHARIILRDGKEFTSAKDIARGEPEFPLTPEEIEKKFFFYARDVLKERAEKIRRITRELDRVEDIAQLTEQLKAC